MINAAITGVGAVTPLGVGADTLFTGWAAGRSGIVDGEGACRDFDPTDVLTRKEARNFENASVFLWTLRCHMYEWKSLALIQ